MMVLILTQNIMKRDVSIIDTYVAYGLPRMVSLVLTLQMSVSKTLKQLVELFMATVYHNGPV